MGEMDRSIRLSSVYVLSQCFDDSLIRSFRRTVSLRMIGSRKLDLDIKQTMQLSPEVA